jgi:hypothetical protein
MKLTQLGRVPSDEIPTGNKPSAINGMVNLPKDK